MIPDRPVVQGPCKQGWGLVRHCGAERERRQRWGGGKGGRGKRGGAAWGSGDGGHVTEECDVIAPGWCASLWLKLHGNLPVHVFVSVPDGVVCKPVH